MSTWTSRAAVLAAGLTLAACGTSLDVTRSAPMQVQLPDGLVVAGARGWCVDRSTSRARAGTSVVVLGSCAAISGNAFQPSPRFDGVVTVSIEDPAVSAPSPDSLAAFLASEPGRAVLARDGRAESVDVLELATRDQALYLHATDTSAGAPNAGADYWRALFDIDGRFVTVSLITFANTEMSRAASIAALDAQVNQLKAANIQ